MRLIKIVLNDIKLFAGLFLISLGIFFVVIFFQKDKINSKADLVEVSAVLRNYNFYESKGLKRRTYPYYLYFDKSRNYFEIPRDFVKCFNKNLFKITINRGDSIKMLLSVNDYNNMDKLQCIQVFGIYTTNYTYLDYKKAINEYNSEKQFDIGVFLILFGLLMLYLNKDKFIIKE